MKKSTTRIIAIALVAVMLFALVATIFTAI